LRTIGGGGGTMSFMVCMSNETGKSLAGVLRDGSRMFGPVMDGVQGKPVGKTVWIGHAAKASP
jgi:hypothetical protein